MTAHSHVFFYITGHTEVAEYLDTATTSGATATTPDASATSVSN